MEFHCFESKIAHTDPNRWSMSPNLVSLSLIVCEIYYKQVCIGLFFLQCGLMPLFGSEWLTFGMCHSISIRMIYPYTKFGQRKPNNTGDTPCSLFSLKYRINRKYWDTISTYHTCPKTWNSSSYYLLIYLKYCCICGNQCWPWSDCSASTLFAKACLSQYLGLLG